jgi:hypothetical protein
MLKVSSVIAGLILLAAAAAQDVVFSPQAIVVNPRPAFDVEVWVDRDPTGAQLPVYQPGEEIRIGVRVSHDAYVYLFNVRSDDQIEQILPNRFEAEGEGNFLRAGETRLFPPERARYSYTVEPPLGLDKVIAIASQRQLATQELVGFESGQAFATARMPEQEFARALAIVVRPVPQPEWVTDTALFHVGDRPAQPRYATLQIRSQPSDAPAFVDGEFVGYTPVDFGVEPGERRVRVALPGRQDFERTVSLGGGEVRRVSATLAATPRPGSVLVAGNVGGATVTLDGAEVGRLADGTGELLVDDLQAGEHRLRVTAPDFEDVDQTVTVRPGETVRVEVTQARTARPEAPAPVAGVFAHLQLQPYPDARVLRRTEEPDALELEFETRAALETVYEHFHAQLGGARRVRLDVRPNRITAEYLHAAADIELDLNRLGGSGRYVLRVEASP